MLPTIFPDPASFTTRNGTFTAPARVRDLLATPMRAFDELASLLEPCHVILDMSGDAAGAGDPGTEGYRLTVSPDRATITASTATGCFYGVQTLRWLLPRAGDAVGGDAVEIPCCEIVDAPRFPYRGFMLDEARYFLGKDVVVSILDWMGLLKLNRFHWHLTEDQGWRLAIDKYPKLTWIGSRRDGTPWVRNKGVGDASNSDGIPHGGFYTRTDITEIVEHARARCIEIVPEIEMPGHATAALASYPELRCILPDDLPPGGASILGHFLDGPNIAVSTRWGVHANIFCAGNPATTRFLHDVLDEVASMFPGPVIHVGGDEVPKAQWMCCERCQARMETLCLTIEEDLQKDFTAGIIDHLASRGKKTMLWNEHAGDELAARKDHAICQFWTGSPEKIASFLEAGGSVVMSPSSSVYLDLAYHALPLSKVYDYDPLGPGTTGAISGLAARNAANGGILGVEAPMWGEVFKSKAQVEHCTFPRLLAIGDTCWSPAGRKDHARFMQRLSGALEFLEELGIRHASLEEADPGPEAVEKARKRPDFGHYMSFT